MKNLNKRKKQLNDYARYSSLALQMIIVIAAGVFGGYKIDKWLENSFPIFLIVLSFFGVAIAIYLAVKDL